MERLRSKRSKGRSRRSPLRSFGSLSRNQARLLETIVDRIFPKTDTPEAVEAGAVAYIDQALAGAYGSFLSRYRSGLCGLERHCKDKFGAPFLQL
ncbi:MAG: gluconate 2-dehydrogenase subunit 3 family protein, partial [Candidatus Binatia bacterium]|nr:gluconate 2-dehydrogenase subunit 3 family protein [Candidatus Binatia bacterium]